MVWWFRDSRVLGFGGLGFRGLGLSEGFRVISFEALHVGYPINNTCVFINHRAWTTEWSPF